MENFDFPLSLNRLFVGRGFDGDQVAISNDQSIMREGTHSKLTSGALYVLCGNQPVMKYWSHNVACDANGNFLGRDEPDYCYLICFVEDGTIRKFSAPSGVVGSVPTWVLQSTEDILNGTITIVGNITSNNTETSGQSYAMVRGYAMP